MSPPDQVQPELLEERISALPGVERLRRVASEAGASAYLVGGCVRDALLGGGRADLDVAVEGDHLAFARSLGGDVRPHPAFLTATVRTPEGAIDVAATRAETYRAPGALPVVEPASLEADLGRRDFTVNAMAVPLHASATLIDPRGGSADLEARLLRVLHPRSFVDDPTRAMRAARYAARLGFGLEPATESLLRATDLATVSAERREAELHRIACEARPTASFRLLAEWGLLGAGPAELELIDAVAEVGALTPWDELDAREAAILAVLRGDLERARRLAAERPASPSEEVAAAHGHGGADLLLARALGAAWLDRYLAEGRHVRLEITGHDLLAAGVPRGPAIGAGLAAALRAKLDGEVSDRAAELEVATAAARQTAS